MVERPLSSCAAWFETMIASMRRRGELGVFVRENALITIFILVVSRSRLKKSQVMAEDWLHQGESRKVDALIHGLR